MKKLLLISTILAIAWLSCKTDTTTSYRYKVPDNISDGLDVGYLSEANIDSTLIYQAIDSIYLSRYRRVHSLLIFRHDQLVLEEYFKGHKFRYDAPQHHGELLDWNMYMLHRVMSVSKSITSVCIGIAIDKGFIKSAHDPVLKYLPEYRQYFAAGKEKITIEHLLTMTGGLRWNEWALPYGNPKNDVIMMILSKNPVMYYLQKQLIFPPGENFIYAGGSNILLAEILKTAAGMDLDQFSGQYLFSPLGISPYKWEKMSRGMVDAAGGLSITPRDMLKIGVTFLNNGQWQGKQIISRKWVDKSASTFGNNSWLNNWDDYWGMRGYSYSWWTHMFNKSGERISMFYAAGWGGQYIMVIPQLDMVVVFTGSNYLSYRPAFEILKKYIITAINEF